jgi:hypothetical protein
VYGYWGEKFEMNYKDDLRFDVYSKTKIFELQESPSISLRDSLTLGKAISTQDLEILKQSI